MFVKINIRNTARRERAEVRRCSECCLESFWSLSSNSMLYYILFKADNVDKTDKLLFFFHPPLKFFPCAFSCAIPFHFCSHFIPRKPLHHLEPDNPLDSYRSFIDYSLCFYFNLLCVQLSFFQQPFLFVYIHRVLYTSRDIKALRLVRELWIAPHHLVLYDRLSSVPSDIFFRLFYQRFCIHVLIDYVLVQFNHLPGSVL